MASDFTVDHAALEVCAKHLDQAAHDLEAVSGKLQDPPEFSPDYFGDYGVADAAKNFVTSWQDELQLNIQALHELAEKVQQSASNYRDADQSVAGSLGQHAG